MVEECLKKPETMCSHRQRRARPLGVITYIAVISKRCTSQMVVGALQLLAKKRLQGLPPEAAW